MNRRLFGERIRVSSILVIMILCLSVGMMIYFGSKKEGLHIDEVYSYGLANSEYLPFMHFGTQDYSVKDWMLTYGAGESLADLIHNLIYDFRLLVESHFQWKETAIYRDYLIAQENSADVYTTTWVSGQDYQDYITVSESNSFNYASVYYNQRGDVHPPLFYLLLHTVCSVFQGQFSIWYAFGLNIVYLALTLILLYRMVSRYLGGEKVALLTVAVYGLSCGFMTTAVFLRMYALLTFMVTACLYVHLKIADQKDVVRGRTRFLLMITVLGGFLTHYYFVIYAILIAVVMVCRMAWNRRFKEILQYGLTLAVSAVIGLAVWPFAIKHVFSGYRGQEALEALSGTFSFSGFRIMAGEIVDYLFGGKWWILWLAVILTLAGCIFAVIAGKKRSLPWAKGCLVVLPAVGYVYIVAQIVPITVERYVMCVFPLWCLFATAGPALLVRQLSLPRRVKTGLCVMFGALLLWSGCCFLHEPGYLGAGGQLTVELPENTYCVYVLHDGNYNESAVDSTILAQCEAVAVTWEENIDALSGTYEYQEGDTVVIAVEDILPVETVIARVKEALGIEDLEEAFLWQSQAAYFFTFSSAAS